MFSIDEQIRIISKGAEEIIDTAELEEKLRASAENRQAADSQVGSPDGAGHSSGAYGRASKIRQFQDLGHRAVIIIGDFTGMIGTPRGGRKLADS